MIKQFLHDIKVIFLSLLAIAVILLIAYFIFNYINGYRYYMVHKAGSINLNYEFDGAKHWYNINIPRDSVLQFLERYHDYIQDEEEYQKLYQVVENKDESTIFVISCGAPIRYFEYYHGDDLYCLPVFGDDQPGRLYIYRVYRKLPEIG